MRIVMFFNCGLSNAGIIVMAKKNNGIGPKMSY